MLPAGPPPRLSAQVLPHRAWEEHVWPGRLRLLPHPSGVSHDAGTAGCWKRGTGGLGSAVEILSWRELWGDRPRGPSPSTLTAVLSLETKDKEDKEFHQQ